MLATVQKRASRRSAREVVLQVNALQVTVRAAKLALLAKRFRGRSVVLYAKTVRLVDISLLPSARLLAKAGPAKHGRRARRSLLGKLAGRQSRATQVKA